jgi:general stress protein CsbA
LSLLKRARKAFWATSVAHFFGFFLVFWVFSVTLEWWVISVICAALIFGSG